MTEHLITNHMNHVDQLIATSSISVKASIALTDQLIPQESFSFDQVDLAQPETRNQIALVSPSFRILERLLAERLLLDDLTWRQLEELAADLLTQDGYTVALGRGTKDGGKDLIATKELPGIGQFMTIWQAKKPLPKNKVGISVIRELADTRNEQKASKGVIVTTSYLTSGALKRVEQDRYLLGKVDHDDLIAWLQRLKQR